jgi:hypothetical protein
VTGSTNCKTQKNILITEHDNEQENEANQPMDTANNALTASKAAQAPNKSDYLVLTSTQEHTEMVDRFIKAGTCDAEVEQMITSRKNSFIKASCKLKKLEPKPNFVQGCSD